MCTGLKNLVCSWIYVGALGASGRVSMGEHIYNTGWKRRVIGRPPRWEGGHKKSINKACGEYSRRPRACPPPALPPLALAACCCALGWTRPLPLWQRPFPWRRGVLLRQRQSLRPSQSRRPYFQVVRHLSKNPIGGKTPIQTKIQAWLPQKPTECAA
jgi:hypothetical protein